MFVRSSWSRAFGMSLTFWVLGILRSLNMAFCSWRCRCASYHLSSSLLKLLLIHSSFISAVTNCWLPSLGLCTCCPFFLKCPPFLSPASFKCPWGLSPLGHLSWWFYSILGSSTHLCTCLYQTPWVLCCWHANVGLSHPGMPPLQRPFPCPLRLQQGPCSVRLRTNEWCWLNPTTHPTGEAVFLPSVN